MRATASRAGARWGRCLLAAIALHASAPVLAQAQKADFEVTEITMDPLPDPDAGHVAMYDGVLAPGEQDHLILSNLSIFQPVKVIVTAKDPARPVSLRLGKFGWDEKEGGGTTDQRGGFSTQFRTQGDLLFSVAAPKGGDYTLTVWRGIEVPPPMEPVLVPPSEADTGLSTTAKLLIGLLALTALGGGDWFIRKRKERPA